MCVRASAADLPPPPAGGSGVFARAPRKYAGPGRLDRHVRAGQQRSTDPCVCGRGGRGVEGGNACARAEGPPPPAHPLPWARRHQANARVRASARWRFMIFRASALPRGGQNPRGAAAAMSLGTCWRTQKWLWARVGGQLAAVHLRSRRSSTDMAQVWLSPEPSTCAGKRKPRAACKLLKGSQMCRS